MPKERSVFFFQFYEINYHKWRHRYKSVLLELSYIDEKNLVFCIYVNKKKFPQIFIYIYINKKILSIELIFLLKEIHKTYSKSLGHVGGCPAPNFKCLIKCEFLISSCYYELIYSIKKGYYPYHTFGSQCQKEKPG